jgi:hypothetical protein
VHAANIQDRDGAALVLDHRTRALFPFILAIFADAGYRGLRAADAARRSGRRNFRVWDRTMLLKEPSYAATQTACDPG